LTRIVRWDGSGAGDDRRHGIERRGVSRSRAGDRRCPCRSGAADKVHAEGHSGHGRERHNDFPDELLEAGAASSQACACHRIGGRLVGAAVLGLEVECDGTLTGWRVFNHSVEERLISRVELSVFTATGHGIAGGHGAKNLSACRHGARLNRVISR
jgi:hypothetical protein